MSSQDDKKRERDVRQSEEYRETLGFLFDRINYERQTKIPYSRRDMNLSRMRRLLELIDSPQQRLRVIHVAGTKGKGSTTAFLSAAFAAAGKRCGTYTSPHLHVVEERFCINGVPCDPKDLVALIKFLRPAVVEMDEEYDAGGPTFFEIATAIAFQYFVQQQVDVAILEVGLGGRLDSTNVCEPLTSVITSISFDHMKQLGNTLAEIATEKAGIIKPGIPVVSGVVRPEAKQVIEQIALERSATLSQREIDFGYRDYTLQDQPGFHGRAAFYAGDHQLKDVELGLIGEHQAANASVAYAVLTGLVDPLRLSDKAIREGFAQVRCAARIEQVSTEPTVILDTAHNVASVESLLSAIQVSNHFRRRHLVLGTTNGKDIDGMLRLLVPCFDHIICTEYHENPRAYSAEKLFTQANEIAKSSGANATIELRLTPEAAWSLLQESLEPNDVACVTGSFFIASEFRQLIVDGTP